MSGIVESHGGTVEKFIGDAVLAVFGVPQVHEDDACGCRAAVEMRDALPGSVFGDGDHQATTSNKPPATSPSAGRTADRSRLPPVSVSLAREGAPFGAATPVRWPDCSRVGSHSSGRTVNFQASRSRSGLHVAELLVGQAAGSRGCQLGGDSRRRDGRRRGGSGRVHRRGADAPERPDVANMQGRFEDCAQAQEQ